MRNNNKGFYIRGIIWVIFVEDLYRNLIICYSLIWLGYSFLFVRVSGVL